jgi:hypothetical protein
MGAGGIGRLFPANVSDWQWMATPRKRLQIASPSNKLNAG